MMELWPFTNFHDLNLDWIIKTIKVYTKKVDDFIADITEAWHDFRADITETWHDFQDWTTGEINQMHDDFAEYVNVTEGALNTGAIADGAITEQKINADFLMEIENAYVTPEMYGYESGDVSSYLTAALANDDKYPVLLHGKQYELAQTVTLPLGVPLQGLEGSDLKWTGASNGTMLQTAAVHANRAVIKGIHFNIGTAETALEVNANAWGGAATVEKCRFEGGSGAIIKLLSAYNCIFKGCEFFTNGYIYLGPYDNEEPSYNTVANCNVFEECYYSGTRGNSTRAFLLENARNTAFYSTAIEKSELAIEQDSNTRKTYVYSCWFENLGSLYTGDRIIYTSSDTTSGVSAFKQDHGEMDVFGANGVQQFYKYTGANTDSYQFLYTADNEISDKLVTVYNSSADRYDTIYKRSTKEIETHVPHNIRKVYEANVDNLSMELDTFFKDGNIAAFYNITAYIYYDDTSRKLSRFTVFQHQATNYITSVEEILYKDGWGTANTATLTASTANNGTLTVTSSAAFRFAYLIVETVPLGYRMNSTNT